MSAIRDKDRLLAHMNQRMVELLHLRNNLTEEEIAYVAERVHRLRDERLQTLVGSLIGWSDEERAEIETTVSVLLEMAKFVRPSKFREAALRVETRYYLRQQGAGHYEDSENQ